MTTFTHLKASCNHDSRLYDSKRRNSNFGYFDAPVVDDSFSFILPPFSRVGSRLISKSNKTWQLWSPNSLLNPFYPGIRAPGYDVTMERDKENRRFDGHLGRFDPTKSPQHYDPHRPWLGFVRRERLPSPRIEHIPLFSAWVSHSPRNNEKDLGSLDLAFLLQLTARNLDLDAIMSTLSSVVDIRSEYWDNRPKDPSEEEVRKLKGELHFADAVDAVASVQRGLRLKSAWVRAMRIVIEERKAATVDWLTEVPFAIEQVLGVWVNGAKEDEVYWLLKHRIPCFIIHEIPASELYAFRDDIKLSDFVANTDADYLSEAKNGFDFIAKRANAMVNQSYDRGGVPLTDPILQPDDRVRSDPMIHGWLGDKHRDLEEVSEVLMKPISSAELPRYSMVSSPVAKQNSVLPVTQPSLAVPEPKTLSLANDRTEWLVPPPIMKISSGKWTMWEEYELESEEMFFRQVNSRPDGCEKVYYDRFERREIFLVEGLDSPPGLVSDINLFGLPAPKARFVEVSKDRIQKEWRASHWLYPKRSPDKGTVGLQAPTPTLHSLPLKTIVPTERESQPPLPNIPTPSTPTNPRPSTSTLTTAGPTLGKTIPTEPRAFRQKITPDSSNMVEWEAPSSLGRRSRTPIEELREADDSEGRDKSKRLRSKELNSAASNISLIANSTVAPSEAAPTVIIAETAPELLESPMEVLELSPLQATSTRVDTLVVNSSDSRFLCFEGLQADWTTCCSWFYEMAVSSHFVWIKEMYRTTSNSTQLVWVSMNSNEDACKLRGFLTHRTMPDASLIISHFVSEATFNAAVQNHTHVWVRPISTLSPILDDPMEGPSSIPLENRLRDPSPSSPPRDMSLLHRAGVSLEERVEGVLPPRRQRGGKRHKKKKVNTIA